MCRHKRHWYNRNGGKYNLMLLGGTKIKCGKWNLELDNSPVWTRQWSFIWWRSLKALPQNSHLNGRSPVCTGKWVISDDTSGKLLPQNLHKTTLPWSLLGGAEPAVELVPPMPPPPAAACMAAAAAAAAAAAKSKFSKEASFDGSSVSSRPARGPKCASCGKLDSCSARLVSRNLSVSSECDRMCRVSLLWCGKLAPQYIQWKTCRPPLLCESCPIDASCNQTKIHTSTSLYLVVVVVVHCIWWVFFFSLSIAVRYFACFFFTFRCIQLIWLVDSSNEIWKFFVVVLFLFYIFLLVWSELWEMFKILKIVKFGFFIWFFLVWFFFVGIPWFFDD